jgi:hypothetical protein
MNNSIDAHIEFSFKGETYALTSTIDLDQLMANHHEFSSLHATLAREHGIDTYSYLYEVMLDEEITFDNAQGSAANFLQEGEFDHAAFSRHWFEHQLVTLLQPIALRELGIADLDQHQGLKNALILAYQLGRNT